MLGFDAPEMYTEVCIRCKSYGALRTLPASTYREAVGNLAVGYKCGCGKFVGMVRKDDSVTFV